MHACVICLIKQRIMKRLALAMILDYIDTGHPALMRMWEIGQRGYRAMGYRITEPQEVSLDFE